MKPTLPTAEQIKLDWANNPRWVGIKRNYTAEDVVRLRGTVHVEHSLARLGAEKLWKSLHTEDFVNALGALTGNQAMQQVKAGLEGRSICPAGRWRRRKPSAEPDVSRPIAVPGRLVCPAVVKRINNTLLRAGPAVNTCRRQRWHSVDYLQPIVADAEAVSAVC